MKAYVFPGQGAQFIGMGKDLYTQNELARLLFEKANHLLGFNITDIMFSGTEEELKQTKVTQPAIFLHSVILAKTLGDDFTPDMVAGHSLGEFSALVANQCLSFENGLLLVSKRAMAMQKACDKATSTMGVVLGLDEDSVIEVCKTITDEIVIPANFNCPGQIVISGSPKGIELCTEKLMAKGAKRVLPLKVSGAFHSPFMDPARVELAEAIDKLPFHKPICPIYQNFTGQASTNVLSIKQNVKDQLTSPVLWTQSVKNMIADGATSFVELGPGTVLQGLIKKIDPNVEVSGRS
ncbi:MAG: ACP S-malonyltransferase [Bacteroidales bacterium]|jgi:[acyl-carrier-protein] S-malonyltransferase|nr:ACP S-malonyltransferase [Bacteroidales bacterium]MDD2687980.1 ACP S-malonyltransferase [Bacteroidales bacterium]MDD3330983.1 ACP S-malonyltransferase [Bacteroidales bacterium]MDD3691960.1 ACP S-malonyltransferase [Bacteroidales bacterium]MDD4045314.1 ACP S-malonyltransferase [Bacteroidales bacterium]